jgi:hypothetical protein
VVCQWCTAGDPPETYWKPAAATFLQNRGGFSLKCSSSLGGLFCRKPATEGFWQVSGCSTIDGPDGMSACLFALSGWNVRGKNTKEPRHIGCKAQYCGTCFVSLNFIALSNPGHVPDPTAAASRYPAPHGSAVWGLQTGPPERMSTYFDRLVNPIPIRGTDYAHHINLVPIKIFEIPVALSNLLGYKSGANICPQ